MRVRVSGLRPSPIIYCSINSEARAHNEMKFSSSVTNIGQKLFVKKRKMNIPFQLRNTYLPYSHQVPRIAIPSPILNDPPYGCVSCHCQHIYRMARFNSKSNSTAGFHCTSTVHVMSIFSFRQIFIKKNYSSTADAAQSLPSMPTQTNYYSKSIILRCALRLDGTGMCPTIHKIVRIALTIRWRMNTHSSLGYGHTNYSNH